MLYLAPKKKTKNKDSPSDEESCASYNGCDNENEGGLTTDPLGKAGSTIKSGEDPTLVEQMVLEQSSDREGENVGRVHAQVESEGGNAKDENKMEDDDEHSEDSESVASGNERHDGREGMGRRSASASFLTVTQVRRGSCVSLLSEAESESSWTPPRSSGAGDGGGGVGTGQGGVDGGGGGAKSLLVMKRDSLSKVPRVRSKIIPADDAADLKAILRRTSLNHVKPNFLHSTLVKAIGVHCSFGVVFHHRSVVLLSRYLFFRSFQFLRLLPLLLHYDGRGIIERQLCVETDMPCSLLS